MQDYPSTSQYLAYECRIGDAILPIEKFKEKCDAILFSAVLTSPGALAEWDLTWCAEAANCAREA